MRRESFRILKVFVTPLLFLVTPFIYSCVRALKRYELYRVYIWLLGSRAGTAELAVPLSRGSFRAEQSRGTDVLSLHPRDAETLFCFHHHTYSGYFMLTAVQRKPPCFPYVYNIVFFQLGWLWPALRRRWMDPSAPPAAELTEDALGLRWPKGPAGGMFSNRALQEVNQTLISAARRAGWLSRVAAHLTARLQDHRRTSQALPGATRPPEPGKGHAAHLLKSPCWGISPRRAPCPHSNTLPASRSAPAQCRAGSSPSARAGFSLHRTATPSTSQPSPAERHPGEPFKQRQEGTSSDAATSQRA